MEKSHITESNNARPKGKSPMGDGMQIREKVTLSLQKKGEVKK